MSESPEGGYRARITEVFPMRLGGETLVDVTVQAEGEEEPRLPEPDEVVSLVGWDGERELTVWAVPRIAQTREQGCFNLQFRRADLAAELPEPGDYILVGPNIE